MEEITYTITLTWVMTADSEEKAMEIVKQATRCRQLVEDFMEYRVDGRIDMRVAGTGED